MYGDRLYHLTSVGVVGGVVIHHVSNLRRRDAYIVGVGCTRQSAAARSGSPQVCWISAAHGSSRAQVSRASKTDGGVGRHRELYLVRAAHAHGVGHRVAACVCYGISTCYSPVTTGYGGVLCV